MSDIVHVAVAAIINDNGEVCISLRHDHLHQGGLWEFPGGKIENDETAEQALLREIREELDLDILQFRPLIKITHTYIDGARQKTVCLHVFRVLSYQGTAAGREGQQVKWVIPDQLHDFEFPAANSGIIKAVQLPDKYLITGRFASTDEFISRLNNALAGDIRLVQLRLKDDSINDKRELQNLLESAAGMCKQAGAKLMLNIADGLRQDIDLSAIEYAGIHADSRTLKSAATRPDTAWFSASCHNAEEITRAVKLDADFIVLSPVQKTASHPDMQAMGWNRFSSMIENLSIPVYALGGVSEKDLSTAWSYGAQGVAAISAFWK